MAPRYPNANDTGNLGVMTGIKSQQHPHDINSAAFCLNMRRSGRYLRKRKGCSYKWHREDTGDPRFLAMYPFEQAGEHWGLAFVGLRNTGRVTGLRLYGLSHLYEGTIYTTDRDGGLLTYSENLRIVRSPITGKFYVIGYTDKTVEVTICGGTAPSLDIVNVTFTSGTASTSYWSGTVGCEGMEWDLSGAVAYWGVSQQVALDTVPPSDNDYFDDSQLETKHGTTYVGVNSRYVFWSVPLLVNRVPYYYFLTFREPVVAVKYKEGLWYIFTESAIYAYSMQDKAQGMVRREATIPMGIKSAGAVVDTEAGIVFANDQGIHVVAGVQLQTLSQGFEGLFLERAEIDVDTVGTFIAANYPAFDDATDLTSIRMTDNGEWTAAYDFRAKSYYLSCAFGRHSYNSVMLELSFVTGEAFVHTHSRHGRDNRYDGITYGYPKEQQYTQSFVVDEIFELEGQVYGYNSSGIEEFFAKNSYIDEVLVLDYDTGDFTLTRTLFPSSIWISQPLMSQAGSVLDIPEIELQVLCTGIDRPPFDSHPLRAFFWCERTAFNNLGGTNLVADEDFDYREWVSYERVDDEDVLKAFMGDGAEIEYAAWDEALWRKPPRQTIKFTPQIGRRGHVFRVMFVDSGMTHQAEYVRLNLKIQRGKDSVLLRPAS